jgi:1-phosphatidylinositol phosphodiesterase
MREGLPQALSLRRVEEKQTTSLKKKRRIDMKNSTRTILATAALCMVSPAAIFAGTEPGYSHESFLPLANASWMSSLPDSLKLSYMSLPGTHDTMAAIGGDSVQTQSMDLAMQLHAGIRVLDIRIYFHSDTFDLSHGVIQQPGNFMSVLQTVTSFLSQNPRETVLMRIKDEHDGTNTRTFESVFQDYWRSYASYFWQNTTRDTNPTLGQLRGKIVVLQNFTAINSYGLNYSSFNAQDNYQLNSDWDLYQKWTDVKDQLSLANAVGTFCVMPNVCITPLPGNENKLYINFLSGATGVFPYFVASGKSNPATGAPLLATGKTTPGWNDWPDFPRVNCLGSLCTIAYEGTDNLTYNWLTATNRKRVGIIMADFPGAGLIQQIIALNHTAANGF